MRTQTSLIIVIYTILTFSLKTLKQSNNSFSLKNKNRNKSITIKNLYKYIKI